jgi:hypothetical protein
MPDDPGNLILVYLRQLDAKVDQVIETVTDHGRPLCQNHIVHRRDV